MNKKKTIIILKGIFIVIFLGFIIYQLTSSYYTGQRLDDSKCKTIGITIKYEPAGRTGTFVVFRYMVKGTIYKNSVPNEKGIKVPGGKYLVKYLCDKPEVSAIYFDMPLAD